MTRERISLRRQHKVVHLTFRGQLYSIGVGRFADGRFAEIFVDSEKQSVDAANDARDLALAVSIGLQHGVPLETLQHSALRDASGAPQGLLGAVCDALAALEGKGAQ